MPDSWLRLVNQILDDELRERVLTVALEQLPRAPEWIQHRLRGGLQPLVPGFNRDVTRTLLRAHPATDAEGGAALEKEGR